MIEVLIQKIKDKDYEGLASCFEDSRNTEYIDYCPSCVGYENYFLYGKNAIEMFFRDKFYNNTFSLAEPEFTGGESATFFGCYKGKFCYCRMTVEKITDGGLVQKVVVRPE